MIPIMSGTSARLAAKSVTADIFTEEYTAGVIGRFSRK